MKCPNCGKEIENDSENFCNKCGFALYGPRNVKIKDLYKNEIDENKIEQITGFKIKDFEKVTPKESVSILNDKLESRKKTNQNNFDLLNFIKNNKVRVIIIGLSALCLILFISLIVSLTSNRCNEKECEVVESTEKNTNYITNSEYKILLPNGFQYMEDNNNFIISSENYTARFYGLTTGNLDLSTSARIKKAYTDSGYNPTDVQEQVIDNHKLFFIKYNKDGVNYCDFYYQYNSEKIFYGVITANKENINVFDENMKKIVTSLTVNDQVSSINGPSSGVDYSNIIGQIFL